MAAEAKLWDAYIAGVAARDIRGSVLGVLREALSDTLRDMEEGWEQRFITTRAIAARARSRVLYDYSELASLQGQRRLVEVLEAKLGIDGRDDVRPRMLGELALSAWRCGARNWVAGRGGGARGRRGHGGRATLLRRVEEAFDAIPASLALTVP